MYIRTLKFYWNLFFFLENFKFCIENFESVYLSENCVVWCHVQNYFSSTLWYVKCKLPKAYTVVIVLNWYMRYQYLLNALFPIVFSRNVYQMIFCQVFAQWVIGGIHNWEVVASKKHVKTMFLAYQMHQMSQMLN